MLEDYRFSEDMAYTSHRLMVRSKDIEIGGVLGAALVSALLVDTDEGNRDQFRQAWNELSRYHEDVRYFVQELQNLLEA